jgi:hypothetical protein
MDHTRKSHIGCESLFEKRLSPHLFLGHNHRRYLRLGQRNTLFEQCLHL